MSYTPACRGTDLAERAPLAVSVAGVDVVLVRCDGEVFALRDECTHAAIPLSEGDLDGCALECYAHGSLFDLRSGAPLNLPATEPVATYPVRIDGDDVLVDVDNPKEN